MAINRRKLLTGSVALGCSTLAASAARLAAGQVFAGAGKSASGDYSAAIFNFTSGALKTVPLPGRGHDIAVRPFGDECLVFARRPGNFAVAFQPGSQSRPLSFHARSGRHFYGHGVFSPEGHFLYTSENEVETGRGVIGVRDARRGYAQIAEFSSGGIGPHDLALLADGHTLVVANGGIETHPDSGRQPLNLPIMSPSLCYIDVRREKILERHKLRPELHQLSIRHLTIAAHDRVVFGCQYKGRDGRYMDLIGTHAAGDKMELISLPEGVTRDMQNYVASIEADPSGEFVVASAPRGGLAVLIDLSARRYIGKCQLGDVSGIAPMSSEAEFLLTSSTGKIVEFSSGADVQLVLQAGKNAGFFWDNHLVRIKLQ